MTQSESTLPAPMLVQYKAMPLAIYREVAAHLQSIPGVAVEAIWNSSTEFNYQDSQIEGIRIRHSEGIQPQIQAVLNYYGSWDIKPS